MLKSFSFSSLRSFRDCPQKFQFQYIKRVVTPRVETADLRLGNIVHDVLKQVYRRSADGVPVSLDDTLALYESSWSAVDKHTISVGSDYMGIDDYISNGHKMLTTFHQKYHPFDQHTLLDVERKLSFTLPGTDFKFSGVIDRLLKKDDGTVEICDYKTGRHIVRASDPDFYYQMGLYQLAVQANFPQWNQIELAQHFLKMDEVVADRLTPERIDQLIEDLRLSVVETIEAERRDDFPTKEGPLCNFCNFLEFCPAKRHRLMLGREEEEEGLSGLPEQQAFEKATELLDKSDQLKQLKAETDALKSDLVRLSGELSVNRIEGQGGYVTVKSSRDEKFVTKTSNPKAFAELSFVARQLELDDYFKLDGPTLMKEVFRKQRLDKESLEKLTPFVVPKETHRVTPRRNKQPDPE
ncbi:MAG: PD-(D/E)XK nuclease family protein [candidate division Zixibacteria bacterium]|nr:PD-(D/E)XK nuclease family protein [candidate division Zixibacteria bacterium]